MLTVCFSTWKSSSVPCTIVTVSMPTCVQQYTLAEGRRRTAIYCGTTGCAPPAGGRVCLLCFERRSVTTRSTAAVTCSARNLSSTQTSRSHCSALSQEQPLRCERSSSRSARLREWAAAAAKFGGYCSDAVRTVAVCTFGTPSWPSHGCHTASAARLAWPLRRMMPAEQADTSLCHSNGRAVAAGGGGCPASSWRSSGGDRAKEGTVQLWDRRACS